MCVLNVTIQKSSLRGYWDEFPNFTAALLSSVPELTVHFDMLLILDVMSLLRVYAQFGITSAGLIYIETGDHN